MPPRDRPWHASSGLYELLSFGGMRQHPDPPTSRPVIGVWRTSPVIDHWPVPQPVDHQAQNSPVGYPGFFLAMLALVWCPRAVWRWALLAGLLLWIELGGTVPLDLQASIYHFPVLSVVRNPRSWYNLYLLFCLAVLAGRGAMVPAEWLRRRAGRAIPWLVAGVSLVYLGCAARPRYIYTVGLPVPPVGPWEDYHLVPPDFTEPHRIIVRMYQNVGYQWWHKDLHWRNRPSMLQPKTLRYGGPPNPRYRGEVYFRDPDSPNEARLTYFTPLEIHVEVDAKEPGCLCINQVRDANWRFSEGIPSTAYWTLHVRLTRLGRYEVRLRYIPVLFYWGLGVTVVSFAAGVVVIAAKARRQRRAQPRVFTQ